jgi:hypothetical protein
MPLDAPLHTPLDTALLTVSSHMKQGVQNKIAKPHNTLARATSGPF